MDWSLCSKDKSAVSISFNEQAKINKRNKADIFVAELKIFAIPPGYYC
jgi:hypothetical protein